MVYFHLLNGGKSEVLRINHNHLNLLFRYRLNVFVGLDNILKFLYLEQPEAFQYYNVIIYKKNMNMYIYNI